MIGRLVKGIIKGIIIGKIMKFISRRGNKKQ